MSSIQKIINKSIMLIQLLLVVIFIVFEEIIWEGFAKPIYLYIRELRILQTIEMKLQPVNRYIVLVLFLVLLAGVEVAGLVAGVMAIKGMVIASMLLYVSKIPIAAFTFWLFRVTDEKLLSFDWFKWSYEKIIALFDWIKSRKIYQNTIKRAKELKAQIKTYAKSLRATYFTGDNAISKRFQRLYIYIKNIIKKDSV